MTTSVGAPSLNSPWERVYHLHVRKTAGTSLNRAFWALGGLLEEASLHRRETGTRMLGNGAAFVRGDPASISEGDYFFASSHLPFHLVEPPAGTFTVTILRDPAARVVSYYRYLRWARANPTAFALDPYVADVVEEGRFLDGGPRFAASRLSRRNLRAESAVDTLGAGQFLTRLGSLARRRQGFSGFLAGAPPRRLMTQLYMFSRRMDPAEAAENLAACDAVCATETFDADLARLSATLGVPLESRHDRRLGEELEPSAVEQDELRERLAPEYRMLDLYRSARSG